MSDDRTTWPVPVQTLGPSSVATVVFRHRAAFHLTVVVKGSFQWVQGGRAQPMEPAAIERFDRPWDGDPARSLERGMELAPFLPRAEVLLTGHAYAPPGAMVPAASVRLGVFRDAARIEKTVHVYGERRSVRDAPRPFQRMPLRWELAWGGPGTANPVGTSAARASAANLVAPDDPSRPASFGPMPRSWPSRAQRAAQLHGLEPPVFDLDDDLDFAVFQSAPDDQLVDQLVGDEWLLVDGVHPSLPRLSTQLPAARAAALVWCEHGASAGMRWSPPLALDMVMIDADRLRLDAVWRGSFTLPEGDAMLPDMRAAAGLETDAPLAWPDVDAALRTRRLRVPAPRAEEVLQHDRTLAHIPTTGNVLPFAAAGPSLGAARGPATTAPVEPAAAAEAALPWEPPPPGPRRSITRIIAPSAGDTPLPGDEPSLPVLPFSPPTSDGVLADPTDADDQEHDDVESTFESLATSSTAPPEGGEPLDVDVPPPPPAPVLVPPPAVGPARMLGGFSLTYGGEREGATPEVNAPEVPPPIAPPSPPVVVAPPVVAPPTPSDQPALAPTSTPEPSTDATPPAPSAASPAAAPAPSTPAPPDPRTDVERRLRAGESLQGASLARLDLSGIDFGGAVLTGVDLTGASLRGCRLVGARLVDAKLAGADLDGADLERADLTRADLARARLVGARLVGATLAGTGFQGADASRADLSEVKGTRASFARARLVGATLVGADLPGADLTSCQLGGANLSGAALPDAILEDAQAEGARFEGARLLRVRAHGARLAGAHLERVDATGSGWDRATLDGAFLDGAILTDASFLRASLAGASLADADLRGAKLANATCDDAILTSARLDGADLRQGRFEGARLDGARLVKLVGTRASLSRASLVGAELRGANLRGARLKQADLTRASLRDADLRDADLEGARLDEADCTGARLQGANLVDATGIDPTIADR